MNSDATMTAPLDAGARLGEAGIAMLHRTLPIAAVAALLSLAACENKPEEVDSRAADPMADQLKNAPAVELPPSIKANVTFRCKDNSLVYVDFFDGDKQANLRTEKDGTPITLKADAAGNPLTGEGYTLTGNPKQIELSGPKGAKTCTA